MKAITIEEAEQFDRTEYFENERIDNLNRDIQEINMFIRKYFDKLSISDYYVIPENYRSGSENMEEIETIYKKEGFIIATYSPHATLSIKLLNENK